MSRPGFRICLVLILAIIVVPAVASAAAARRCGSEESTAARRALATLDTPAASWVNLHQQFERFGACDDWAVGEAFGEAVSKLLTDRWPSLVDLASLGAADPGFREFVIGHIDESAVDADLIKAARNADHACPAGAAALCRAIASAAIRALALQQGMDAGDPEMPALSGRSTHHRQLLHHSRFAVDPAAQD